jgi:transposase-like protein
MEEKIEKTTKIIQVYPQAFRRKVVQEYISGNKTQRQLMRKYGIKSKGAIPAWIKFFGYVNVRNEVMRKPKFESITYSCMPSKTSSDISQDPKVLQKKVAELERQLQDEKLRSEAYKRMIEKAEKELNITIRKKPFTR